MGTYKVYFESLGIPAAALSPTLSTLKKVSDGSNVTPPSITEVGGGWYKFSLTPTEDYVAVVDGGTSLDEADRYASGVLTPDDFAATEVRLAELGAANIPADVDTLLGRITAARATAMDNLDATVSSRATPAQVNTEADTALADYDPPTRTEATADKAEVIAALAPLAIEASVQGVAADIVAMQADIDASLDVAVSTRATPGDIAGALGSGVLQSQLAILGGDPQTVVRGDVAALTFALGTAWDLTGKKAFLCVKSSPTLATSIVNRELTVTDAASGACEIALTATETGTVGSYYAEVEVTDADGASNPRTAMQFRLLIVQDVRR